MVSFHSGISPEGEEAFRGCRHFRGSGGNFIHATLVRAVSGVYFIRFLPHPGL